MLHGPVPSANKCRGGNAGGITIQLPYPNNFSSFQEYCRAFDNAEIDFNLVIGVVCPICHGQGCFRPHSSYKRTAVELDLSEAGEVHSTRIAVARFFCRKMWNEREKMS